MALSTPFVGSGEFVNVTVWSCPVHDDDVTGYDEGDPWEHEGEICLDCETGRWVAKRDTDGNIITRELSQEEAFWRKMLVEQFRAESEASANFLRILKSGKEATISWSEDVGLPRIVQ